MTQYANARREQLEYKHFRCHTMQKISFATFCQYHVVSVLSSVKFKDPTLVYVNFDLKMTQNLE